MNLNLGFFYLGGIAILASFFIKKERKKTYRILLVTAIFFLFTPSLIFPLFPRHIFGKWDSIKKLNGEEIVKIIIQPSLPGWKVNLTDSILIVYDKGKVDTITKMLRESQVYFPNRYLDVWKTTIILISKRNDSLSLKIERTTNETDINNQFRNDKLGAYLEKMTSYTSPSLGGNKIGNY